MKEPRLKMTEKELVASAAMGDNSEFVPVNLAEHSIDNIIQKENTSKFNNEVDKYIDMMENNQKNFEEAQSSIEYDIHKAEIKPMFSRILIKPFKTNPFQEIKREGSIIIDAGGFTPRIEKNPMTGKFEEQKQFIVTGYIVDVGPDVKYLEEGDVVYYRVDTAVPVPFLKQGCVSVDEKQVIAVVNEGLTDRFNKVKGK